MGALAFALDLRSSHATLLLQDVSIFRSVCWVLPAFMLKSVWEKVARSVVLERPFTAGGTWWCVLPTHSGSGCTYCSQAVPSTALLLSLVGAGGNGICRSLGWGQWGVQGGTPSGGAM